MRLTTPRRNPQHRIMSTNETPSLQIPATSMLQSSSPCGVGSWWSPLAWAMLLIMVPAICPGADLEQCLCGKRFPLTVKLKDLTAEWRRVTVHGNGSISGNMSVNVSGNAGSAVSQNNLTGSLGGGQTFVTKGQTASANGKTYLIAYHLPMAGLDLGILLQAIATKTPPAAAALTPESGLSLSLLDVGAIGSLEDVSAFDLQRELSQSENAIKALTALLKGNEGSQKKENKPAAEKGR